jgi:GT2 family glycosyltransferase
VTHGRLAEDLSIIVPTVGREHLRGCLESIGAGTMWPKELIVVDQSRHREVGAWLETPRSAGLSIVHIRSSQRGIAASTNRGLEQVSTPFVGVTHDDCRVEPDWVEKMQARLQRLGEALLTGRVEPEGEGLVLTINTRPTPAVYTKPMIDRDVLFPPNMGFPIRVLDRIGYFDEHPSLRLAGEDNDWAHRALKAGVAIVYDPTIAVRHLAWQDPSELSSLYRRYARGQGSFYGKHMRRGDLFIFGRVVRDFVRTPWLLLRGAATRNRELVAMGLGEMRGLLPGLIAGLRNRGDDLRAGAVAN